MIGHFRDALDQLIQGEQARADSRGAAEKQRALEDAAAQKALDDLQPRILEKLKHVTLAWKSMVNDINDKSADLGFTAGLIGVNDDLEKSLQINFYPNEMGVIPSLRLSATHFGQAVFTPGRAGPFDLLGVSDRVFQERLLEHVKEAFYGLKDSQPTAPPRAALSADEGSTAFTGS